MNAETELLIAAAVERGIKAGIQGARPICQPCDELLSVAEVAKILKIGLNYATELIIKKGVIPSIQLNGRKVRRKTLEAWLEKMEGMDLKNPENPVPILA